MPMPIPRAAASGDRTSVGWRLRKASREAMLLEELRPYCGGHDCGTGVLQGTGNVAVVMRTIRV
jgi:hypothetical protein